MNISLADLSIIMPIIHRLTSNKINSMLILLLEILDKRHLITKKKSNQRKSLIVRCDMHTRGLSLIKLNATEKNQKKGTVLKIKEIMYYFFYWELIFFASPSLLSLILVI
jgi:hypothetical protein